MKRTFLGDSYDSVKRFWGEVFSKAGYAKLYAEPSFIPEELREDFTRLTKIAMLPDTRPASAYAILNDPDTGIRLPGEKNQRESSKHICISTIVEQLNADGVRCVVTFDQSYHRRSGSPREEQMQTRLRSLRKRGCCGFYYVSHAPFLFAFRETRDLAAARQSLEDAGMPADRLKDFNDRR